MKIWLINPYGPIPGESWRDYSFAMMAEALEEAGHDVIWWTSNFSHHFKSFRSDGWQDRKISARTTIRLVPTTGYKKNVGIGRILRDFIFAFRTYRRGRQEVRPDCIVYSESPLTFGFAGQRLGEFHNSPVIFDQMDLWPELFEFAFPKFLRPIIKIILGPVYANRRRNYEKLNGIMALAKYYLEAAFLVAPVLRTRHNALVYNGIDVDLFRSDMLKHSNEFKNMKDGKIWAIFAGSLGPSYDIPTLINVAKNLQNRDSKLRIIIAGDGPYAKELKKFIAENGDERLFYLGKLSPKVLSGLYSNCDIALCAYSANSNVEMPDKIYDYTAAGLPIINSLLGEVSSVISSYEIGLKYNAGSSDDLLRALLLLETNGILRAKMAENSIKAGNVFDKKLQYKKFVSLVEHVAKI